jgi:hypothetical protein
MDNGFDNIHPFKEYLIQLNGAGEKNRTSDLRVTRTRRQRIPSHIQQRVAPLIYSDINFDGTLYRKVDTTLKPQLYRL